MFPREVFFLSQLPGAWVARSVSSAVWRDVSVWQHLSRTQGCALYLMQSFLSDGESLGEHGEIGLDALHALQCWSGLFFPLSLGCLFDWCEFVGFGVTAASFLVLCISFFLQRSVN